MKFPKIEKYEKLLEIIINQVNKDYNSRLVYNYIDLVQRHLNDRLLNVFNNLPDYKVMNNYYRYSSQNIVEESTMEKHKNHYLSTLRIINQLSERYKVKIKKLKSLKDKNKVKKEYLGRIKSTLKKLESTNIKLRSYKKDFERIANPKPYFTIVLVGLPNSGKTTLISEITDANPEINSYAFTTKALNLGYFKKREKIIQVIDTPGLIHLDFKKMNIIEKQAIAAIKELSDIIVYLYNKFVDYESQKEMLDKLISENPNKKILVYPSFGDKMKGYKNISKKDILELNFD